MKYEETEYDGLVPGSKRHRDISSQLDELEVSDFALSMQGDTTFLPSTMGKKKQKKEKKEEDFSVCDEWFESLIEESAPNFRKGKKERAFDLFSDTDYGKKKKKKKPKADELTDFNKEFEPEIHLYRSLLRQQTAFTDSLQREYDSMTSKKSSARGVNKVANELIENITSARALAMQLVDKNVSVKKTIADLTMKERKEKGSALLGDGDLGGFAASYLKKMISERQSVIGTGEGGYEIGEYNDDDIDDVLNDRLSDTDRAEEVNAYLRYENRNITIYARVNENDLTDYDFEAQDDETGEIIYDYPMPMKTRLSVNRSTSSATDEYGQKYPIIWT